MKVTSKGQVTIPKQVRQDMGIRCAETEVEFVQDGDGRWFLRKAGAKPTRLSRFHTAYKAGKSSMTTEEIMALTRSD